MAASAPTGGPGPIFQRSIAPSNEHNYPYAAAPDVIRANQKDVYLQSALSENISTVVRKLYGARFLHRWASEARVSADLIYFGCTTFLGNRTLGEEYCDIVQIEGETSKLPSIVRRSGYILSSVLLPYIVDRILPVIRARARARLDSSLSGCVDDDEYGEKQQQRSFSRRWKSYVSEHLATLTSPDPIYAIGLAVFYFSGAYYHISKRIWGLRYVFTKRVEDSDQRVGYEVLGVLLVLQMAVQGWLHVKATLEKSSDKVAADPAESEESATARLAALMNTPLPAASGVISAAAPATGNAEDQPRYSLASDFTMAWIESAQQRKCTLCLEPLQDPSLTTCGHVFCWTCIADWVREKPECPLCRGEVLAQHVLPLRG